ncbi:MAG: hypothetical protein ACOY5G_05655 [Pseudomonadota bacterium]
MSNFKFSLKAISVVAGMVVGVMAPMHAATAGTVNLTFNGAAYGYENFNLVNGTPSVNDSNQAAGGFTMQVNANPAPADPQFKAGSSILAWCIELTQSIGAGSSYNYTTTDLTSVPSWAGRLQELIAQNYQTVLSAANSITSAAMQLAIWEVVYEPASSALNLSSGNFSASAPLFNGDSTSARNMAQGWLNNLSSSADTGKYKIVMLTNGSAQDLVTVLPTPIPAAALLFGSALGLGGLLQRRRRATPTVAAA